MFLLNSKYIPLFLECLCKYCFKIRLIVLGGSSSAQKWNKALVVIFQFSNKTFHSTASLNTADSMDSCFKQMTHCILYFVLRFIILLHARQNIPRFSWFKVYAGLYANGLFVR